jgi:hypothetical protein
VTGEITELVQVVRDHESSRPRSLQVQLGPSEVGTACARRLAYKLLQVELVNDGGDPWARILGTAAHAWLDDAFAEENVRTGDRRWITSVRVEITGYLGGTIDLYDAAFRRVIDHKVVGATTLRSAVKEGPSEQYRTQCHLYAFGLINAGYPVEEIGIMYWPRTGYLKDAHLWTAPYDEAVVEQALRKIDALRDLVQVGTRVLPLIPTGEAHCLYCPNYLPASTIIEEACPGHKVAGPAKEKEKE